MHSGLSAVERRPADVVSQPLIIQDQVTDRVREPFTLPSALEPPGVLTLASRSGCPRRLDGVGRRSELVRGDVRHRRGLAGGICGMAGGAAQLSSSRVGHAGSLTRSGHRDLAAHPGPSLRDRPARARVQRSRRLEQLQDVLRTRCGPEGEQLMVGVGQRPPAADGDEARVALFREDHGCTLTPSFKYSTYPSVPLTRIRCRSRITRVACSTPTTAGKPYSRAITAPWVIRPPTSVTRPVIATNRGDQLGSVCAVTRMSPGSRSASAMSRMTRARPSTGSAETGKPTSAPVGKSSRRYAPATSSPSDVSTRGGVSASYDLNASLRRRMSSSSTWFMRTTS